MVIRLQPYRSASSRSVGMRSPGRHSLCVEGRLQVAKDLVVQWDGPALELESRHSVLGLGPALTEVCS